MMFGLTRTFASNCTISSPTTASATMCNNIGTGDTIFITSTLTLNASYTTLASIQNVVIIVNGGTIDWAAAATFQIGTGGKLQIINGGTLTNSGGCNANYKFLIGSIVGSCSNSGDYLFSAIVANGGFDENGPLPVEIVYFNAKNLETDKVLLSWSTASETNNSHFEIFASSDAQNYTYLGRVEGHGNSTQTINYDEVVKVSNNECYFKLVQVDFDGNSESFLAKGGCKADVLPSDQVNVRILTSNAVLIENNSDQEKLKVTIVNIYGQTIVSQLAEGVNTLIDLSNFDRGFYLVSIDENEPIKILVH
ncbi:MAG: T9SS type A sorting domain-containing protein [Flavobacteriales bacterium]|nr:T9SS type A sorting domain-containing protein [Flavobacteriales bacterium]